jgi:hypothetical protein
MRSIGERTGIMRAALTASAGLAALCCSTNTASAQSLNVDVGDAAAMGVPSATYGAAAEQVGHWNGISAVGSGVGLKDLNGVVTGASLSNPSTFGVTWDNAGTLGDDQLLLDDLGDPGSGGQFRFDGLIPGGYEVWTYAWAPDSAAGLTTVVVTGASETAATVGGAWTGSFSEGVTHSVHHVVISGSTIRIDVAPASGSNFASVNGFQLVYSGQVSSYCFGSGTAPCPCGNQSPVGAGGGCGHGGGSWVVLGHNGTSLVAADDIRFYVAGGPPNSVALLLQGSSSVQWTFKDGLLCVGAPTERIEVLQLDFLGGAQTSVSIVSKGQVFPGDRRYYQLWYLDPLSACGTGMNTSNGLQVDWL